jgi:uncharacterized protein DUF6193
MIFARSSYPEFRKGQTLGKAILDTIALSHRETALSDESKEAFSARFQKDRRIACVKAVSDERMFIADFSMRGVRMILHATPDLRELARAVEGWLIEELTLREMKQRLPDLDVSEVAFETEAGRGVAARWKNLLQAPYDPDPIRASWLDPEFYALVRAASTRPLLRQLVPLVDLGCMCWVLLFSRTQGHPYAIAGDCRLQVSGNCCIVVKRDGSHFAEGVPGEMLDVFERTLPAGVGPAIFGTAADLGDTDHLQVICQR